MNHVLLMTNNGLGNFLLTIPVIIELKKEYAVTVYTKHEYIKLVKDNPAFDKVDFVAHSGFFVDFFKLNVKYFSQILYTFPSNRNKEILFLSLLRHQIISGYHIKSKRKCSLHVLIRDSRAPKLLNEAVLNLKLAFPDRNYNYLLKNKNKYMVFESHSNRKRNTIVIHPGSDLGYLGMLKRWPNENWLKLVETISQNYRQYGITICVALGPKEKNLRKKFESLNSVQIWEYSLTQLSKKIANSMILICNDSGIAHLAALTNIPVITLFGPVSFVKSHPLFNLKNILTANVYCSPCQILGQKTKCTNKIYKECMKKITVDMVYRKINETLNEKYRIFQK